MTSPPRRYCNGAFPVIAIKGYAAHGKDEVGKILARCYGLEGIGFSDPICEAALKLDPMVSDPRMPDPCSLSWLVERDGWIKAKEDPDIRVFLQTLGGIMRQYGGRAAIANAIADKIKPEKSYYISGLRLPIEVEVLTAKCCQIKQKQFLRIVHVFRPDFINRVSPDHETEKHIEVIDEDAIIVNDGTLEDLALKVHQAVAEWGLVRIDQ